MDGEHTIACEESVRGSGLGPSDDPAGVLRDDWVARRGHLMSQISPILLTAHISIPPGGAMGVADSTRLENPFQGPMWLDEVRFRIPNPTSVSAAAGVGWSSLRVELKLGDIPITNGYGPISLLGKVLQEASSNTDEPAGTNNALLDEASLQSFTWKLPKPLYIPARE